MLFAKRKNGGINFWVMDKRIDKFKFLFIWCSKQYHKKRKLKLDFNIEDYENILQELNKVDELV